MDKNGWCYVHNGRPGAVGEACICGRMPSTASAETAPNLWPVILWLEGGCDPKEAAKELRIYAARMGQPAPASAIPGVEGDGNG